jgi:hypothetical protein
MRGAELVALASAHGIDLTHVELNGSAAPLDWMEGCEIVHGARKSSSDWRRSRRPERNDEPRVFENLPWLAACYSLAGDASGYWSLWDGLVFQAQRKAGREHWPPRVRTAQGGLRFYLLELAQLVLDEEASRALFVEAPQLRALCLGVEYLTWDEVLARRYRALQEIYGRWVEIACEQIRTWVNQEEPLGA